MTNLKSGLGYLFNSPILRSIFMLAFPVSVTFGLANSLLLPFATKALSASTFEFGVQEGLTSVGFVIASLLMAGFLNRLREGQWIVIGLFGMEWQPGLFTTSLHTACHCSSNVIWIFKCALFNFTTVVDSTQHGA